MSNVCGAVSGARHPTTLDQRVARNDLVRVQKKQSQQHPRLSAPEREVDPVAPRDDRTEDPELHEDGVSPVCGPIATRLRVASPSIPTIRPRNQEAVSAPSPDPTLAVAAACTISVAAAAAGSGTSPFVVKSSLDAHSTLPRRIHWLAYPSLTAAKIQEVDFTIDGGPVRWTEHNKPYSFSDDGGYLVTTWLKPGPHRFTVKAIAKDGRIALDTVTARVAAPPPVPSALKGTWAHTPAPIGTPGWPNGTYKLVFDPRWIELIHPGPFDPVKSAPTGEGYINYFDWDPGNTSFHVQGVVTLKTQDPTTASAAGSVNPAAPTPPTAGRSTATRSR